MKTAEQVLSKYEWWKDSGYDEGVLTDEDEVIRAMEEYAQIRMQGTREALEKIVAELKILWDGKNHFNISIEQAEEAIKNSKI